MRLARQAEKNLTTDLVYETPPPRTGFVCFPFAAVELRRRNARSVTTPSDLLVGNVRRHALNPSCYRTRFVV